MNVGGLFNLLYPALVICGLAAILVIISTVLTVLFLDRHIRTCPGCRSRGTGYIVNTEIVESDTHIDYRGGRGARVKKEHLVDHYQCERCSHRWTRSVKRTERIPHEPMLEK